MAHAPVEPHTAVADVKDGKATVWASTQSPFGQQAQIARALGFREEDVRVITPYVGGGFGGKGSGGQGAEAGRLSQIVGKPVMVAYTRAEEFFYDTFGPAAVVKVASGIDGAGRITFWDYQVYAAGGRGTDVLYDIPNRRVRVYGGRDRAHYHFFGTGPWRAPGASSNKFGYEQQMDAMARAAGMDPLAFRLKNTKDPRMVSVLRRRGPGIELDAAGGHPQGRPGPRPRRRCRRRGVRGPRGRRRGGPRDRRRQGREGLVARRTWGSS